MLVVTVNGRRVLTGNNATVALLLQSLGYPARGIAVALTGAPSSVAVATPRHRRVGLDTVIS